MDIKRVAALTQLLSPAKSYEVENLGTDSVSGYNMGFSNWCYNQDDPVFNPATSTSTSTSASASYTIVLCGSPACDALLFNDRHCHIGKCGYEVNYTDGSYTKGTLMLETLTFGQMRIQNMAMGCGHNNQGSFNVIAGLLGLGGGRMSFVNQIPETGGAFSYCLLSYNILSTGWLRFGCGLG
ncbi:hypothetical protein LWI29_037939 [Acer saccharum]|uniref:Peptidase A1 domain-containing protein n=1 Tax=Acer saccharum TaxID=4024 RepID=A0AA39VD99_ACESA|nr:hypothetical protein LWI29_037939 [Acer saccharum]KAK1552351.1 hypothetical protein Q3G72_015174 [Acer saccharum]